MAIKEKRSEATAGLFLLIGLSVLGILVAKFGRIGENSMEGKYTATISFADASGLIKGSEIRMGGARIGKVTNVPELQPDLNVLVKMRLNGMFKIDKNSKFVIESLSIIGDKMIVVKPAEVPSGEYISEGSFLTGAQGSGLDALQADVQTIVGDAKLMMKDAQGMIRDASVTLKNVDESIGDIRLVAQGLNETITKINTGVLDDKSLKSLQASIANFESITESFIGIGDEVQPTFVELRQAIAGVNNVTAAATKTFDGATEQIKNIEPALATIPDAVESFQSVTQKAEGVMGEAEKTIAKINDSDGLIKTLTDDKEFSQDTKKFVKNLKHYGILRYKDDESYDEKDPKQNRYRSRRR